MTRKEKRFVEIVWEHYKTHGRRSLPWRQTQNPYRILVSEIMLQQTQVERVLLKYVSFLKRFPTLKKLSEASLGDVLREWQGLGYNRRAKMLHQCAIQITNEYKGKFPKTHIELMKLPGVGHYTAGAIMAFAYNIPIPIIETNIRTVFIHNFFHDETNISDQQLFPLMGIVLDEENPREWYYALMDYGSFLKKTLGNPNSRSKHYVVQTPFKNSDRQIRGAILKLLSAKQITRSTFHKELSFDIQRIDVQLERLINEKMIIKTGQKYRLP
ncbi:MAG: A/G-specific adenine glycosylase [Minisyncoccia bacterium]